MPYPADERLNATSGAREQQSLQQPDLLQGFPAIADALYASAPKPPQDLMRLLRLVVCRSRWRGCGLIVRCAS